MTDETGAVGPGRPEPPRTSVQEQSPDDAEVEPAELVASDVVEEVRVLAEAVAQLRVREEAQLREEFGIEARRRGGAPRARARATAPLRRDAPPHQWPSGPTTTLHYAQLSHEQLSLWVHLVQQFFNTAMQLERAVPRKWA